MPLNFILLLLPCLVLIGVVLALPADTALPLPAADPNSNRTDPCAFSDRHALLNRIQSDWQSYSVSLLVAACADVCPLIYERTSLALV
jgi:hypothetical protein